MIGDLAGAVGLNQPGTTRAQQRSARNGTIRKVVETTMRVVFERFEERLGVGVSTAQAVTVASANAGYALAFDADRAPSRGPASRSAADCESRR
jgi:hypothetical protein